MRSYASNHRKLALDRVAYDCRFQIKSGSVLFAFSGFLSRIRG